MKPRWRNGRRVGLKNLWGLKPHEGSTPSLGTLFGVLRLSPEELDPVPLEVQRNAF